MDDDGVAWLQADVLPLQRLLQILHRDLLRNSDDQGTQFDLRVEVYSGATLVASGEKRCITGLTRNPTLAQQVSVPLTGYATGPASVKILTRIGTTAANLKCGPAREPQQRRGIEPLL